MKRYRTFTTAIALALMLSAPGAAHATDGNRLAGCKTMAEFARTVANARDHGVPLERVRETMEKDLPASDQNNIDIAITAIYKNPNTPPDFFANATLSGCMTPGSAMEGGIGK